jgi:hypothetical protein
MIGVAHGLGAMFVRIGDRIVVIVAMYVAGLVVRLARVPAITFFGDDVLAGRAVLADHALDFIVTAGFVRAAGMSAGILGLLRAVPFVFVVRFDQLPIAGQLSIFRRCSAHN